MRLPNSEHLDRPWRIHELVADFRLEDVWALPTPGGPDELRRLVDQIAHGVDSSSPLTRALFAIRWKIGGLLGLDGDRTGLGSRVPSLRDRLPADLRDGPRGPDFTAHPFAPVYLLHDEFAAEIANRTVHAVMHVGWVADPSSDGGYRGQMAVLARPNGLLGDGYMALIDPFRRWIVYPSLMRDIGANWHAGSTPQAVPAPTATTATRP